jgi:hypothetical protein
LGHSDERQDQLTQQALGEFFERLLASEILTEDQQNRLFAVAAGLGFDEEVIATYFHDLVPRVLVAAANDGRLPNANTHVLLRKNEVGHFEVNASLMKEMVDRQWQGESSGFSFRVARGVRYHSSGARGRSVVTGTHLEEADSGSLAITSQRAGAIVRTCGNSSPASSPEGERSGVTSL